MAKFEINEAAVQRAVGEMLTKAIGKIDQDMARYRGQPAEQVRPALEKSMRQHGIQPNPTSTDFTRMVDAISAGGHLR